LLRAPKDYFFALVSHESRIGRLLGSIAVKAMPIPEPGREYATLPCAWKFVPPCEILKLTFVPSGNGDGVFTPHPNRLKSRVCAAMCFSDCVSVSSMAATKG
jgi:hypothetical protein